MKYKEIIKKIFFILCLLVICISNKCYSFDNCLNKFPSYWDSEKKKKSDTDTALGEYLINYVAGTSALVNTTSTDMEKWSSNDGITQTTSECILWINQYTHKKDMDYVKLSGYINDNTYNIIKNVFELYFSSKNIDAINQDIKANYNETNKTNKYDTDNSKGYYGIDEQDYLYYGVISKNYVEVIKNCKETIQEMTASAAYAKQQGIDTKVKTKFKASDGKYIDFQDDYNTKINYTKDQIKKYLDVYGIRLGETGDNRSTLISQWASLIRGFAGMTQSVPLLIAGTVISGAVTGLLAVPVSTLFADGIDYGEYKTNRRIEGMGSAITSFSQKISSGLAQASIGWILGLTGYISGQAVQSGITNMGIISMYAWMPAALLLAIFIILKFCYKYEDIADEVINTLENRKKQARN